jgi:hypothetical protein
MTILCIGLIMALLLSFAVNMLLIRTLYKEHNDTCNRLMSRDYGEYKASTDDAPREPAESQHKRMIEEWRNKGKKA